MVLLNLSRSALRQSTSSVKKSLFARSMSTASPWSDFAMAPPDPIVGLNESFAQDDFPNKVIIGVGAYRDDAGKPYVLPCVREAEKLMMDKGLDMEYAGIVSLWKCSIYLFGWWKLFLWFMNEQTVHLISLRFDWIGLRAHPFFCL
jgi:hypothetical protein